MKTKAVFLDFYNTLVRFWPPLDEIQQAACSELGLNAPKEGIRRGYVRADEYMSEEGAKRPLAERNEDERDEFFAAYEQIVLRGAGLEVSLQLARDVWKMAIQVPKDFTLFDDVISGLELLRQRNVVTGLISNLRRDMTVLCEQLGLSAYLDFVVTPVEAGAEKPDNRVFLAALERAQVDPAEAVHVGDQYKADAQGARAVGITPVLMDREGWHQHIDDCPRIASLPELDLLLANGL